MPDSGCLPMLPLPVSPDNLSKYSKETLRQCANCSSGAVECYRLEVFDENG